MLQNLAISVVLFASAASLAAQPVCTVDPNTGFVFGPPKPGVCFNLKGTNVSFFWAFGNDDDGVIVAFVTNSSNSWVRVDENNQLFGHLMKHDADLAYCPESVILAGKCIPPEIGGTPWFGSGQFTRNGDATNPLGSDTCPFILHYSGEVTSPGGDVFKIIADELAIKDKDSPGGCREIVNRITLKAK